MPIDGNFNVATAFEQKAFCRYQGLEIATGDGDKRCVPGECPRAVMPIVFDGVGTGALFLLGLRHSGGFFCVGF